MRLAESPYKRFMRLFADVRGDLTNIAPEQFRSRHRQALGETVLFLTRLKEAEDLSGAEEGALQSWLDHCIHALGVNFGLNEALTLQYVTDNLRAGQANAVTVPNATLVALRAIELQAPQFERHGTVWRNILEGYARITGEISPHLGSAENPEPGVWFVVLNALETAVTINHEGDLEPYIGELSTLVKEHEPAIRAAIQVSPPLGVYIKDLHARGICPFDAGISTDDLTARGRIFFLLGQLERGEEPNLDNLPPEPYTRQNRHLWWICEAWMRKRLNGEALGILPFEERDVDRVFAFVWARAGGFPQVEVTDADRARAQSLDADEVEGLLRAFFEAHPHIPAPVEAQAEMEEQKAHTGAEIADFHIQINFDGQLITVAIPVKSGPEIQNASSKRVGEAYFNQFIRPLLQVETNRTYVFPVILGGVSVNARSFVTSAKGNWSLPIETVGVDFFVKSMKRLDVW